MTKQLNAEVEIVIGSDSDWPVIEKTVQVLKDFNVPFCLKVLSAHRTPDAVADLAGNAQESGLKVFIAAAGGAAHLAGSIAAHTILPVIGIPVDSGSLNGLDSLLSTIQMPSGIPVGTVALGKSGGTNAALLAIQILAISSPDLSKKLIKYKNEMKQKVKKGDSLIQSKLEKYK
jgi:phosphoribosylaminoimidazole carboxylase PurE protein